ncbi:50S ribosomal protein L2 [Candidatus Nomurabacteria bacterium]|nr:50S ribosomal protein L2 [Candidatus Saccharibacteria bacterium]MCB9839853.1 50S ribosomal protein L2 [Candidatus Nomurabacteria bacterium]
MAIKILKPTTPGRRGMTTQDFDSITTKKPVKSLIVIKKGSVGRNNQGRITTRHRGGGVRRYYRLVNFKLEKGTEATVEAIEYDPNRSARIARLKDQNGKYHYIIAAEGLKVGTKVSSNDEAALETGNRLPLKSIAVGSNVYSLELQPGRGAQIARSAGNGAQLIAKDENWAQVKLPSGEVRQVSVDCMAHVGTVGNAQHQNIKIGKAGRNRKLGKRPSVRGVVMNAVDHPHGGGDGGRHRMAKAPRTPWGQKTLGFKTRRRKDNGNFIIKSRHQAKRRG